MSRSAVKFRGPCLTKQLHQTGDDRADQIARSAVSGSKPEGQVAYEIRAFVDAQIGMAVVELAALRVVHQCDLEAIASLREQVRALEAQREKEPKRSRRGENQRFS